MEGEVDANNLDSRDVLNCEISEDEILKYIKKLKNGKCSGMDEKMNKYIKVSCPIYVKLCNFILESGHFPESWIVGIIKPLYLYKSKGYSTAGNLAASSDT